MKLFHAIADFQNMDCILQTPRLILREFTIGDAHLLISLNSDPEVIRYVHEEPLTDIVKAQQKLEENILSQYSQYGYGRWAVHLKNDAHTFIGWCGLKYRPEREEVDLGYRFIKACWGCGYAFEAAKAVLNHGFQVIRLPRITAMAHVDNAASLHILEKCGMNFIGNEIVENCPVKTYQLTP